jgi:phage terminase small subunit
MTKLPIKTADTPTWAANLSLRERLFVEQFIIDLNGRQAAIRAGLGKSIKSATEIASRMRKKSTVAAAISALMAERSGVTGAAVVGELGALAFSRITQYLKIENGRLVLAVADLNDLPDEAVAAIAKLRERVNDDGTISIEVELHDKVPALKLLGNATGVFVDRKEIKKTRDWEAENADFDACMSRLRAHLDKLREARLAETVPEIEPPPRRIAPPVEPVPAPVIDAD